MFSDFTEAFAFMVRVAVIAEKQHHHPDWRNNYNEVEVWLSSHEEGGLITDKDEALALAIDDVFDALKKNNMDNSEENNTTIITDKDSEFKLYTDGGSRGNPGPSAGAYLVLDSAGKLIKKEGYYLGITTNNQAEYQALRHGMEQAAELGIKNLSVYMDSLLLVNQMKGIYKVKNRDLWPIYQSAKETCGRFSKISFTHVPRELNKEADTEVNRVLDEQNKV